MKYLKLDPTITAILGTRGKGKTLLATYLCYQHWWNTAQLNNFATFGANKKPKEIKELNKRVFHNGCLNFGTEFDVWNFVDFGDSDFHDAVILLDEIHMMMDSRSAMSTANKVIYGFITQMRKKNLAIIYTTQDENSVDFRLRQQTDWSYDLNDDWSRMNRYGLRKINEGTKRESWEIWFRRQAVFNNQYAPPNKPILGVVKNAHEYKKYYDTEKNVSMIDNTLSMKDIQKQQEFDKSMRIGRLVNYLAENDVDRISSAELATIFVKESREVISPNAMAKELRNLGLRETRSGNAKKFDIKKLPFVD